MSDSDIDVELEGLYADREPSRALEERVVSDWRELSGVRRRAPARRWSLRAAAAVVLLAAGWAAGRWVGPGGAGEREARYMLLLWEGPGFAAGVDPSTFAPEYAGWARGVASSGIAVTGEELALERAWVGPGGASERPPGTAGLRLGGYFLVDVADEAAARRLARAHPHLGHGGWIEVAPLVGPPPDPED